MKVKKWLPKFRPWFLGSTIANRSYVGQINHFKMTSTIFRNAYLLCHYGWTNRGKWRHEQGIQSSRSNLANIYYECTTWWNCSKSKSAVRNKANMTMVKNSKKRRRYPSFLVFLAPLYFMSNFVKLVTVYTINQHGLTFRVPSDGFPACGLYF